MLLSPSVSTLRCAAALAGALALAGCGNLSPAVAVQKVVQPYRMDLVQGNVVTREQVAALRAGMARAQVKDILGTPLLTSVFHAQRWDYVFTLERTGAPAQQRHVSVFFKDDVMERVEADELPTEAEFASTLKSPAVPDKLPAMEASRDTLQNFPAPATKPTDAPLPAVSAQNYPPLEPLAH